MTGADMFGIDEAKATSISADLAANPRRNDRRICVCGHSFSRHDKETKKCNPVSFACPCKRQHPILEVKNTRYFIARSAGSGEFHALVRGYVASKNAIPGFEESVVWLAELKCENKKCGKPTKLYPVRTDELGYRLYDSDEDRGVNGILCEDCRTIYRDSEEAIKDRQDNIKAVPNN